VCRASGAEGLESGRALVDGLAAGVNAPPSSYPEKQLRTPSPSSRKSPRKLIFDETACVLAARCLVAAALVADGAPWAGAAFSRPSDEHWSTASRRTFSITAEIDWHFGPSYRLRGTGKRGPSGKLGTPCVIQKLVPAAPGGFGWVGPGRFAFSNDFPRESSSAQNGFSM